MVTTDAPELALPRPARVEDVVRLAGVGKAYPGADAPAVRDLDLGLRAGEVLGLLGPNGAGKTTTIELIAGLRRPTTGQVRVLGLDPARERDLLRSRLAVQPQHAALFESQTVDELVRTWATFYPAPHDPAAVVRQMGLQDSSRVRVRALSGGQRQRLLVALALVGRPELLVLDEPSTGLDPNARGELWTAVRDVQHRGGTVLLSTHSMEEAEELCGRVAVLHQGRLVALGTVAELIARHAPQRRITFSLTPAATEVQLTALRRLPGVLDVEAVGRGDHAEVTVRTTASDDVLAALPAICQPRGLRLLDGGLDGVFRALTAAGPDQPAGPA